VKKLPSAVGDTLSILSSFESEYKRHSQNVIVPRFVTVVVVSDVAVVRGERKNLRYSVLRKEDR
jgi:hypothetical protein